MSLKYRIVTDRYNGFEVQWRSWWQPFWLPRLNTHSTIERAEEWAANHAKRSKPGWRMAVVKELGDLSKEPRQ